MPPITPSGQIVPQIQPEAGDLVVTYLEQLGVEYVFGVPGGAIEPLYNALARSARRGGPRPVVARHETGAAFMADGYARNSGKLGVCCATTGPGATNLITGVASAYENHIPMLVITAQTALRSFGRGAEQESSCTGVNTVGMFHHCTRYNTLVSHIDQFERKLATAIMTAFQSPTGPTHLSVPLDVMRSPVPVAAPTYDIASLVHQPALTDDVAVDWLYRALNDAENIVFVIGDGCSKSVDIILRVALALGAKIVTTPHGKGLVSPYHPLYRGVIGLAGHKTAIEAVCDPKVELVVCIGARLTESVSGGWDCDATLKSRLIHVDSDQGNFAASPMAQLHVRGNPATIFNHLLKTLLPECRRGLREVKPNTAADRPRPRLVIDAVNTPPRHFIVDEEAKCRDDSAPVKPQRLMTEIARLFPPNTRYLADSGSSLFWSIHYLHPLDRRLGARRGENMVCETVGPGERRVSHRRADRGVVYWTCLEYGSMGWAIGAAVGTALACRGSPVVCLTGDGSCLMNGQEITVALQEQLPVVFVVLNDSAYGMVKHGQVLGGAERVGYELPQVDFAAVGRAMGVTSHTIYSPQDLESLDISRICGADGPTLLDVHIDPDEAPPMASRLRTLGTVE